MKNHRIISFFLLLASYRILGCFFHAIGFENLYPTLLSGVLLLFFFLFMPGKKHNHRKLERKDILFLLALTLAFYFTDQVLTFIVMISSGNYDGYRIVAKRIFGAPMLLQVAVVAVVGPIAEEILFRFFLFRGLRQFGFWVAALSSSVIFGLAHQNFFQFVYAGFFGVCFCCVYERYGTLKAPLFVHIVSNTLSLLPILLLLSKVPVLGSAIIFTAPAIAFGLLRRIRRGKEQNEVAS